MFCEMKCCVGDYHDDDEQYRKSRKIDQMLAKDKRIIRKEVKLLLLGAGESGKSTFLKQMRIIHGYNFEGEMIREYKTTIYQNIIKGMKVLIDARYKLDIPWGDDTNSTIGEHVFAFDNSSAALSEDHFLEYAQCVRELWNDEGIRTAYERRTEFQLVNHCCYFYYFLMYCLTQSDGVRYFFDNINRIATKGYVPTNKDILYSRKATKCITEYSVTINDVPFRFVDVGGQRSQRQKWFQCFDSVTSILFLVSSSEYNQVLLEDRQTNRLTESLNIFDTIANNRCFLEVSIILFLNKTDLLIEKLNRAVQFRGMNGTPEKNYNPIAETPLTIDHYFPEFKGDPLNVEHIQNFLLLMFDNVRKDKSRQMYHHFTTAVDTENIKYVFNAVRNTILQKNITQLMLQ